MVRNLTKVASITLFSVCQARYTGFMRLFGRRANQQSATEVPPELQQYYGQPTLGTRLRRASLFVLPILAFLVVLGVVLGGAIWLRHHKLSDLPQTISRQTTKAPKPAPNKASAPSTSEPSQSDQQSSQTTQPGQSQTIGSSQQTADNTTQPQASTNSEATIPNTGPGEMTFVFAAMAALIGAAAFHIRQMRSARSRA